MKNASSRIVLGFFSGESGNPETGFQSISGSDTRACLFRADGRATSSHDFCARYGALRLHGEALVITRTTRIQETVQKIRTAGSPSVFVVQEPDGRMREPIPRRRGTKQRLLEK